MIFNPTEFNPTYLYKCPGKFGSNFEYSNLFEQHVSKILFPDHVCEVSEGKCFSHDFIVRNIEDHDLKIEIKTSAKLLYVGTGVFVENMDGQYTPTRPSGLSLTESDFYLFIRPEWNKDKIVVKLRLVPTHFLHTAYHTNIHTPEDHAHINKSIGFYYNIYKQENHIWCGDFSFDTTTNNWDVSKLERVGAVNYNNLIRRLNPDWYPLQDPKESVIMKA